MNEVNCLSMEDSSAVACRRRPVPAGPFGARKACLSHALPVAAPVRQLDLESWDRPEAKAA